VLNAMVPKVLFVTNDMEMLVFVSLTFTTLFACTFAFVVLRVIPHGSALQELSHQLYPTNSQEECEEYIHAGNLNICLSISEISASIFLYTFLILDVIVLMLMNWFSVLDIDASLPVKLDVKSDWIRIYQ
jgi:hypothetical protein